MPQNNDNLLAMALQVAMSRAHPSPIPSNYVLTIIEGPSDPMQLGDTVTSVVGSIDSDVYAVGIEYTDWAAATLTNTQASGYGLTLTGGQTSGTAVFVADLGANGAAAGAALTVTWESNLPTSAASVNVAVAFGSSASGPFGAAVTVTNGQTVTPTGEFCQVTVTLSTTNAAVTPAVLHVRLYDAPPWGWGEGRWSNGYDPLYLIFGLLPQ